MTSAPGASSIQDTAREAFPIWEPITTPTEGVAGVTTGVRPTAPIVREPASWG
ncbi:MAG TPA: hypothetical protein VE152_05305 [Acidimicrobiales bacterium]|nr:hypothetical protein [Acidimicrobiales bacterium]